MGLYCGVGSIYPGLVPGLVNASPVNVGIGKNPCPGVWAVVVCVPAVVAPTAALVPLSTVAPVVPLSVLVVVLTTSPVVLSVVN